LALVENKVVKAADNARTAGKRQRFPSLLDFPGARYGIMDAGWACNLHMPNDFSRRRISNFDNVPFSVCAL
jgi:hypothetical protein